VTVLPVWSPSARELDDVEMLLLGAYRPLRGFLDARELAEVREHRRLPDGSRWCLPVSLTVPEDVGESAAREGGLELRDEEGTPIASVQVSQVWPGPSGGYGVAGELTALRPIERGVFRSMHRQIEALRPVLPGDAEPVLAVPLRRPLHLADTAVLRAVAADLGAKVLLMPLTGSGTPVLVDAAGLVRSSVEGCGELLAAGLRCEVVPVPLPYHGSEDALVETAAGIAGAYGASHVALAGVGDVEGVPPVLALPSAVRDLRSGRWELVERLPADVRGQPAEEAAAEVVAAIESGAPVPPDVVGPVTEREMRRAARARRGVVVMFTGLSGSGKSTLARALCRALEERDDRTTTLLDGDVVRRMLSSGLTFSRADRELNVRRIGYVASVVAGQGGIAVCAPIAPFAAVRDEVRQMVEETGGRFVLVYVSTPLGICEKRDRKGLYAKARRGEIPQFTGVSDPYEEPSDADVVVDTTGTDIDDVVSRLLAVLFTERASARPVAVTRRDVG
jgi:sulfate adenylyltransferase